MECGSEEEVSDFTRRVHTQLAQHMNVQATSHTSADKVEYAKRKLFVQPHSKSYIHLQFYTTDCYTHTIAAAVAV